MLKNVVLNLENKIVCDNHPNVPSSFRMLVIGSSSCGKTVLVFRMLIESGFIDYENLIIFTSTPQQPEYQLLFHAYKNGLSKESIAAIVLNQNEFKGVPISTLCKKYAELHSLSATSTSETHKQTGGITCTLTDRTDQLIPPQDLDRNKKNLVIFDDCISMKNQKVLASYFNRGRHNNCIYLSQSYFDLDRMIRLISNILVLFKLSQRNKSDIFNNVVGTITDKNEFDAITSNAWSKKYGYIVINRFNEKIFTDIFEDEINSNEDLEN
jgi:GTPase SAR1 family protein